VRISERCLRRFIREELIHEAEIPDELLGNLIGSAEGLDPKEAGLGDLFAQTLEDNPDILSGEDAGETIEKIVADNPDALKDVLGDSPDVVGGVADFFEDNPEAVPEEVTDAITKEAEKDTKAAAEEVEAVAEGASRVRITKRQLRRIIREEVSDLTHGSQRYYTDAAGKRQPVPSGDDLSRRSPAETRAASRRIPSRDDYFDWVKEKGHATPMASSVLASYVIDSGISEEEMGKVAAHMSIDPRDVLRDVDRQLEEKEIQGL